MNPEIIHVNRCTLKRICRVSGLPWDYRVSELACVYTKAITEDVDWQAVYTDILRDISKYLSKEQSLHRLTTAEELYRTTIRAATIAGSCSAETSVTPDPPETMTFGGDIIFIGSLPGCDFVVANTPPLALIIATLPRINRILIVDPGSNSGYRILNTNMKSYPGKRIFTAWNISSTINIRIENTVFTVFAK